MPRAPKVEVFAPTTLFAGHEVSVEVVVTAEQATKIEYIDARITGHEGWRVGSGKNAVTMRAEYPQLVARLTGEGSLPAGTSRYRTSFRLPADMPPSHSMEPAWAWLEMYVRVAIPWWPDGKYRFTLPVRVPPPPSVEREPYAVRSSSATDAPRLELSLASTRLIAGETVVGSLAVFHLDDRKARDVELTLVPTFKLHRGRRVRERRGVTLGVTIEIPAGAAGETVPFHFELPSTMTPSFKSFTQELSWWLVAKTGSFFGPKVDVLAPLTIFDASAKATSARLSAAPRLTDERITGAFSAFASARGWRQTADEREPEQLVYEREVGDMMLRVGYAYRGEAGTFLVTRVTGTALGLDLAVTPSSRVRELLTKDIEIDLAAWDRAHHVTARSQLQAEKFLITAAPAVMTAMKWLGAPLRQWNDDEIVFERPVSTVEPADLEHAHDALEALAQQLAAAPIDPPAGVTVDLDAWKQLAHRMQGRLSPGNLSIAGTFELRPARLDLEFDGETPVRLHAQMGEVSAGDDHVVTESIPVAGALDIAAIKELLTKLRAELARREPNVGPYR